MSARAACALLLVMVAAGCQAMIASITPVLMDYHKELRGVADALADVSPRERWERPVDGFDVTSITTLGAGLGHGDKAHLAGMRKRIGCIGRRAALSGAHQHEFEWLGHGE